ncbi:Basic leucine zipper 61 [Heracleum sosnowskyi]|uniref:Basic leucine zipper 61 n=1 Tax=Heracleum sosnowskyi TaxID=360622 RepID=A0AAD8IQ30_9APIA|nr:Basic leucine zipper 61 [Heracleum sosnowskyi]
MAQLPPKVPNMTPNWPNLSSHSHHHTMSSMDNLTTSQAHSWVDDFLNFSSTSKRGSHRRSASDSIAFLDQVVLDGQGECGIRSSAPGSRISHGAGAEFDRFDEEQFMDMFTDHISVGPTVDCSNSSSPSNHDGMDHSPTKSCTTASTDQQMQKLGNKFEESESALDDQHDGVAAAGVAPTDNYNDKIFDPRRVKRILANRQSAQRSRVRKMQYVSELERAVNSLQAEIAVLSPRVAFLDHQRLVLNVDNSVLKQRIAALSQDKVFKDAHQEALKREIERLRQVHNYQQDVNKIDNDDAAQPSAKSLIQSLPDKISDHPNCSAFSEQIMIR